MDEIIKNFPKQFEFNPEIINIDNFKQKDRYIVCGMGGSHLSADILRQAYPTLDLVIHNNYGLPEMSGERMKERLVIVTSYSGNTEEAVSSLLGAINKNLSVAVISSGGKLLSLAKENNLPYIELPKEDIPPRMALGYSIIALLKLIGDGSKLEEARSLVASLDIKGLRETGKSLAERLNGSIPLVYASAENSAIAYIYKITFNESVKIPSFYNLFPELNHNEMEGFDVKTNSLSGELSEKFHVIFLKDNNDHPRVVKRMETTAKLLGHMSMTTLELERGIALHKIFSAIIVAYWASVYLAGEYKVVSGQVPLIEEFKNIIK
ncbi:MAG: hypothetical protein NUV64_01330 [Parcubacteria group bacterium]|nr:hypothetical protein [Parcubacteria group bacterium]MCR4343002.1 hypothetical protein [Patescibacteria group bacterium]